MSFDKVRFEGLVRSLLPIEAMRIRAQVRQSHLAKRNNQDGPTQKVIEFLEAQEAELTTQITSMVPEHPAYPWFSQIKGIGLENIAKVVGLVSIDRAPYVSSLWKYAGQHVVDGKAARRTRGQKLDHNLQLKTMCWRVGMALIKAPGKFQAYYNEQKEAYALRFGPEKAASESARALIDSKIKRMALRKTIKLFLSLLWVAWRQAEGLPVNQPYVQAHLGHQHIVQGADMTEPKKKRRIPAATV